MTGSKFGETCPRKNIWIVAEASEITANFVTNIVDEITKFISTAVVDNNTCFNLGVFSSDGLIPYLPTYTTPDDPKKGSGDAIKWIGKILT